MVLIAIVVAVAVVLIAVAAFVVSNRRSRPATPPPAAPRSDRPEPPPMTGLEEALNRATDRSGTTMADRIDAESDKVEGMRVVDDTGPLLRRVLDRFDTLDHPADQGPADGPDDSPGAGGGSSENRASRHSE